MLKALAMMKTELILSTLGFGELGATIFSRSLLPHATRLNIGVFDLWSLCMDCDIDHEALAVLTMHEPSPTSVTNMAHWSQLVRTGKFEAFDHGVEQNLIMYGTEYPEEYNVSNIKVPIAIYYGDKDYLANPKDIEEYLLEKLPNVVYKEKIADFKHNDFVWGKHACTKVYISLLDLLNKYKH
jgi:pimeloyl-ACP methyl ester carboxylesterase